MSNEHDQDPDQHKMRAPTPNKDFVTTISDDGSRPFLYPADAPGRFFSARFWSGLAL